ncbi:MAG TPA: hypothetical protein VGL92_09195, partial [Acidimicrobiia bacterium]
MPSNGPPNAPVFVLGTRGGQRLAALLDLHPHLCGVPNSGLLAGLVDLVETNRDSLVRYGLPDQYWRSAVARFLAGLQEDHTAREGKTRWVEWVSSPRLSIGELDRFFPGAQLILVSDRPLLGRRRRVEHHAAARPASSRYLKVRDADLTADPERCLREVLRFLREPWSDVFARAGWKPNRPAQSAGEGHTEVLPLPLAGRMTGASRDSEII